MRLIDIVIHELWENYDSINQVLPFLIIIIIINLFYRFLLYFDHLLRKKLMHVSNPFYIFFVRIALSIDSILLSYSMVIYCF